MTVQLKGARPMFKGTIVSIEAIFIMGALLNLIAFSLTSSFRLISLTLFTIIKSTLSIFSFVVRVSVWRSGGEDLPSGYGKGYLSLDSLNFLEIANGLTLIERSREPQP